MSNNGLDLEKRASSANVTYTLSGLAFLHKVPTAVSITNGGLTLVKSTVDYMGVLQGGQYVAFDAKETSNKTRFPLNNIKPHQLDFLNQIKSFGGLGFFLVHFKKVYQDQAFAVPLHLVNEKWNSEGEGSISLDEMITHSPLVQIDDYLSFIEMPDELIKFHK